MQTKKEKKAKKTNFIMQTKKEKKAKKTNFIMQTKKEKKFKKSISDSLILKKNKLKFKNTKNIKKKKHFGLKYPKGLNKKVVKEIHHWQQILENNQPPDEEELELQHQVFGGDIEIEKELDEIPIHKNKRSKNTEVNLSDEEQDDDRISVALLEKERKPAWVDDDDDTILVKEKADTLRRCHRSIALRGKEKYSNFVKEKFIKIMGQPQWADLKNKKSKVHSDDESEDELMRQTGNYIQPSLSLTKGIINIRKCANIVDENVKGSLIKTLEFHPTSKVAMVAAANGTATLYQIDGKINAKIQAVHFENFPINTAHFTMDGDEIIAGSKFFQHFFSYNMLIGKIVTIRWDKALGDISGRKFFLSPDGKYIVIFGHYGNMYLITTKTKEWIHTLKMNGEVRAITFTPDGSKMYSHGEGGEIYVWDMSTRSCIHKFTDHGCITGTSLAFSSNGQYFASGSDSGVVNIYDSSKILTSSFPEPLKAIMNLTTEITCLKFNHTSELLAMASDFKANAIKLVHFPSMTVFSNFPTRERNLRHPCALDISLNSGYLSIGNNKGMVYLYRLKHYSNY